MAVSKALRFQVLRRDNHTCRYCGRSAPEVRITVDHVVATALGGSDTADNLVAACADCNGGKSATPADAAVIENVSQDALRWARAQTAAAERMLADLEARTELRQRFLAKWGEWSFEHGGKKHQIPLPDSWVGTLDSFIAAGLPFEILLDCLDIAMRAEKVTPQNTFRYMCGIGWKRVAELQEATHAELGVGEPSDGVSDGAFDAWSVIPRGELEEHLWRFDMSTEAFLQAVPVWVHERAERLADHDWACAGEPDVTRLRKLPDVLRHVGGVLSTCHIDPQREEAE